VKVSDILERFKQNTRARLKESSQGRYEGRFRQFSTNANLERYTRRQLRGKKGKTLILKHIETVPLYTRQNSLAALRTVWIHGLELPWPIDNKRDISRFPQTRRCKTPSDNDVKQVADAIPLEKDAYLRSLCLMLTDFGVRPSHITNLEWSHIQTDASGKPYAIIAEGGDAGFKTNSPLVAWIPSDLADSLAALKKVQNPILESPIFPRWHKRKPKKQRSGQNGSIVKSDTRYIRDVWFGFINKYGLPRLRPKDIRHWVSTVCRKAGLSKAATAAMQGHNPTSGESMRDWYDNPPIEDILDEQKLCLPRGTLGTLTPPEVRIEGLSRDALSVVSDWYQGKLADIELLTELSKIRRKDAAKWVSPEVLHE